MSGSTVIIINEGLRAALPKDKRQRLDELVSELEAIADDDDNDNGDDDS